MARRRSSSLGGSPRSHHDRLLIKESVNQTVDNMGFYNALQACFTLHQLNHAHWAEVHENKSGRPARGRHGRLAGRPPVVPAVKDKVRASDVAV